MTYEEALTENGQTNLYQGESYSDVIVHTGAKDTAELSIYEKIENEKPNLFGSYRWKAMFTGVNYVLIRMYWD